MIPGPIACQLGEVDLTKINEATAEKLIALKNPYIRRATVAKKKTAKPSEE